MGLSNGIGTIAGLLCPIAIDYLTSDQVRKKSSSIPLKFFKTTELVNKFYSNLIPLN